MPLNILIDPLNKASSHLFFNSSIASFLTEKEEVVVIAEADHVKKLEEIVFKASYRRFYSKTFIGRIFKGLRLLVSASAFKKNNIVFLCFDNTLVPLFLIILYPFIFKNSFAFILHNNLTTLCNNRFKGFIHHCLIKMYHAKIYVLTNEMKRIYDLEFRSSRKSILIPHPNYKNLITFSKKNVPFIYPNKINIIVLGRQAKLMMNFWYNNSISNLSNLHFTIVNSKLDQKFGWSNLTVVERALTFDEYYTALSLADFSLFAIDKTVENRASGILMDCVSLNCPVIAPLVGHHLEYKDFKIGFFYQDYDDLKKIFESLNNSYESKQRNLYKERFLAAVHYSSPTNLCRIINVNS